MILHILDAVEVIPALPFRPNSSVVSLDMSIPLWLAGLDLDQADPCFLSPVLETTADVFGAVVDLDRQRLPAHGDSLFIYFIITPKTATCQAFKARK